MIKTQYYIVLFFAICSSGKVSTQGRLLTTQYIFNKLSINPAFAGTNQTLDFTVLHRSQWQGIKTAPTHQNISTNFPKIKDALGLGININHLSYGITRSFDINLPYSYSLKVGNYNLSFGSAINFKSYQENYSKELVAIDDRTIDPSIPNTNLSSQSLNFGLGIYFSNNTSFLGLSTQSLVNDIVLVDNNVLIPSFRSLDIMGGLKFDVGSDVALLMQGMGRLATQFGSLLDLNAGFEYQNKMNFGIGMRLGTPIANAMTFNAGFDVVNGYIGFAYEYPLSQLRGVQLGTYEIIGFYSLKLKKSKYEGFNPRFF